MTKLEFFTEKPKGREDDFEDLDDLTIEALRAESDDDDFDYDTYEEDYL